MTTNTFAASTMIAPAECHDLAWSECDDEPYFEECPVELYDETHELSSRWAWALVIAAWVAGAAALAVVVGFAFVAFTPQPASPDPHSSTVPSTPPGGFIGNLSGWVGEPAQNT